MNQLPTKVHEFRLSIYLPTYVGDISSYETKVVQGLRCATVAGWLLSEPYRCVSRWRQRHSSNAASFHTSKTHSQGIARVMYLHAIGSHVSNGVLFSSREAVNRTREPW